MACPSHSVCAVCWCTWRSSSTLAPSFFSFIAFVLASILLDFLALWVSVHEEINHDIPFSVTWDLASELQCFTSHEPEHVGNGVTRLVVGWDGRINPVEWRVGVTKSNDWDVHV